MLKIFPIMLALCFMLSSLYYAENYAGIIDTSLPGTGQLRQIEPGVRGLHVRYTVMEYE